jgi:hypothetical protein
MNEAYDQKPEKKMKSPVSRFVYKSLSWLSSYDNKLRYGFGWPTHVGQIFTF